MADSSIPVPGTSEKLQTYKNTVGADEVHSEAVTLTASDGTLWGGAVVDSNNTTTTPLTAGATYTGTATDVLKYPQMTVQIYARPGVVAGDVSSAMASFYFEFSPDGTNWDTSVPHVIRDPSLVIPIPIIFVHRYFRVRYVNDGGTSAIAALGLTEDAGTPTAQTVFRLTTYLQYQSTKELTRTLDQSISHSDPTVIVESIDAGEQYSGTFVKAKADGNAFSTTSNLLAGATYTSDWIFSEGWRGIELYIAASHVSGTDGVQIEYTPDGPSTPTPTAYPGPKRTYTAQDVTNGFLIVRAPVAMHGFRVKFTNGGTNQTSFLMNCHIRVENVELPQATLGSQLGLTSNVVMTKGGMVAYDGSAVINLGAGTSGGLDVGIVQHEVETPIESLSTIKVTRTSMTTTAARVVSTPQAGRRSISIKCVASGSALVYIGHNSSVNSGNGYPLSDGQSIDIELDDTFQDIYGIASTGTQAVAVMEVY